MTFRPSDDVLEGEENAKQVYSSLDSHVQYDGGDQGDGQYIFHSEENLYKQSSNTDESGTSSVINIPVEEVKAPDLSELLKNNGGSDVNDPEFDGGKNVVSKENTQSHGDVSMNSTEDVESVQKSKDQDVSLGMETGKEVQTLDGIESNKNLDDKVENAKDSRISVQVDDLQQNQDLNDLYVDSGKISDEERFEIISGMKGGINSNLDFLVDKERLGIVEKYKKINRFFFRWGIFVVSLMIGIFSGVFLSVKAGDAGSGGIIHDSLVKNKDKWVNDTSDKILSSLIDSGVDIEVMVPYGSVSIDGTTFQSKSNLVSYKGIVLPQLSSIDYNSENFVSLSDFNTQSVKRKDVENLIDVLILKSSIYRKTANLPNVSDFKWIGDTLEGSLLDGFSLKCVNRDDKVSDFVCDKFLGIFTMYGKYYDLSKYSSELLGLVKDLMYQGKNIDAVCNMVSEYVLHAGVISDNLTEVMSYCKQEDFRNYKKVVNFIDLENSLGQPELSDRVFDDPDLNAYKLLSAWQSVYKILDGTAFNENYVKSYLNFVQALINKDRGSGKYLLSIYKDLLYVFNNDELYPKLMQKGNLSSDIKLQIDQINNGNSLYGYPSLVSQLTVPDIIQLESDYTGMVVEERTIEDIFSQYYAMKDRLTIRKVTKISDDKIRVQTEMFTDKIMSVTDNETLKITVVLYKQDNLLYVESIRVSNQRNFSDILNMYLDDGDVTFYAMMGYIEEQVGMWYEQTPENDIEQPTFCEQIQEREDISLYICDDESISLYKGDVEYAFQMSNGVLDSFTISDEALEKEIKKKLDGVMFMRDDTPSIIISIIDFSIEKEDNNLEKKLDIMNQFRIHFKLVPDDIHDIEGESDLFLVDFTLGEFKLQAHYNTETRLLTKITYVGCSEKVEIRNLSISLTTENDAQLIEILNNPRIFLVQASSAAYKKYQKVCGDNIVSTENL